MKRLLGGAVLIAASCSGPVWVKPTEAGAAVRVTSNAEAVRGCELVGPIEATGFYGPDEAIAIMQNKAAEKGANVVLMVVQPSRGVGARGEAYRCPSATQSRRATRGRQAPNFGTSPHYWK